MHDSSSEMRRLQWHCRRGMLELDVLLERFLANRYLQLSAQKQQVFIRLLSCADQDLWNWLVAGQTSEDLELQDMVKMILQA
jgi:antitoxin CptB